MNPRLIPADTARLRRPGTTGRSHSRPGFSSGILPAPPNCGAVSRLVGAPVDASADANSQTPAARSGAAEAGDRRPPSPLPSRTAGRRTFFAFLAGGLAWRAQQERPKDFDDIHAEPWSGPISLETVTVTVVPQHPENSSEGVSEARQEQRTVAFGETGAKGVREIRGVRRVS